MKARPSPVFMQISCFPAKIHRFQASRAPKTPKIGPKCDFGSFPSIIFREFRAFRSFSPFSALHGSPTSDLRFRTSDHPSSPIFREFRAFRSFSPFSALFGSPTSDLRLRTSAHPSSPVASHFQTRKRLPRSFSVEKCLARAPFSEIGITWRLLSGIKPTSRAFSACPPAPYSPNPQPLAPLTRPRISATL